MYMNLMNVALSHLKKKYTALNIDMNNNIKIQTRAVLASPLHDLAENLWQHQASVAREQTAQDRDHRNGQQIK